MKKTIITLGILVLIILGYLIVFKNGNSIPLNQQNHNQNPISSLKSDPKNATYIIDGKSVTLKNGVSETESAPGSSSKIITKYFGNEVKYDFDKDGNEDTAFLLTQETGGSGVFYYLVVALQKNLAMKQDDINIKYIGSQAFFLGDRIAPQSTNMGKGNIIIVNYADRKSGESFSTPPSVGKSIYLILDTKTMQFGEVVQNFEGEADPARMTLNMKTWSWINTIYNDGKIVKPTQVDKFKITFKGDKTFSASTDCNGVGGEYNVNGNRILLEKMMSTLMFCEGSQESEYSKMLSEVQSYHFTSKGELIFDLKFDSGSMIFK